MQIPVMEIHCCWVQVLVYRYIRRASSSVHRRRIEVYRSRNLPPREHSPRWVLITPMISIFVFDKMKIDMRRWRQRRPKVGKLLAFITIKSYEIRFHQVQLPGCVNTRNRMITARHSWDIYQPFDPISFLKTVVLSKDTPFPSAVLSVLYVFNITWGMRVTGWSETIWIKENFLSLEIWFCRGSPASDYSLYMDNNASTPRTLLLKVM